MTHARARKADPETSHEAADGVERDGKAERQRDLCLYWVRARPGLTAAEIARVAGLERHVPSRRLPELREDGKITSGAPRICREMGRRSMTWWAKDARAQGELFGA